MVNGILIFISKSGHLRIQVEKNILLARLIRRLTQVGCVGEGSHRGVTIGSLLT